jgi:hypothetical protein
MTHFKNNIFKNDVCSITFSSYYTYGLPFYDKTEQTFAFIQRVRIEICKNKIEFFIIINIYVLFKRGV